MEADEIIEVHAAAVSPFFTLNATTVSDLSGSRDPKPIARPLDMYEPDLHIDTIKLNARNFR